MDNDGVVKWKCEECGNVQDNNYECYKCGAPSRTFTEVKVKLPREERVTYEVIKGNIIHCGQHLKVGTRISLSTADPAIDSLLRRKLIKKVD